MSCCSKSIKCKVTLAAVRLLSCGRNRQNLLNFCLPDPYKHHLVSNSNYGVLPVLSPKCFTACLQEHESTWCSHPNLQYFTPCNHGLHNMQLCAIAWACSRYKTSHV